MRDQTKKRSNLRDVAHRSGVSVATVSRVLNMPDKVAAATRDRVERAIEDLRFVPSAMARAMNRGNTGLVAALLPTLDNAIYARVVDGLEARLTAEAMSLMVAQTGDDPLVEFERAQALLDIGAEALIVVGITHDPALYKLIERTDRPCVVVSYFDPSAPVPTVGYDNRQAALIAADHFVSLGHRDVGVLHGSAHNNDRMRARIDALNTASCPVRFSFVETDVSMGGGFDGVERLLDAHKDVTGVLCFSDVIAHGALHRLNSLGIDVPGALSLMGIEDLPGSRFTHPALTSVKLSVEEMGQRTADAIVSWLRTGTPPASVNLPVELVVRGTTARAPEQI